MSKNIKIFFIFIIAFLWINKTIGQNIQEYQLKVHFIDSFCKFIDYTNPNFEKKNQTFNIVIIGKNPFDNYINLYFRDRKIKDKTVVISHIYNIENLPLNCDAIYISKSEKYRIIEILDFLKYKPILSIGDTETYGELGVHINMFLKNRKIRFEINEQSLLDSKMKANYRLIQVAKVIHPQKK